MPKGAPVNGGAPPESGPVGPYRRVSEMQAKLHRWAAADPGRRFDDLFNFVCEALSRWLKSGAAQSGLEPPL